MRNCKKNYRGGYRGSNKREKHTNNITKNKHKQIITPHKEIMAETTQKPPETTQAITMETLEDLTKITETLIKPILHTTEPTTKGKTTHTFYILDNNTKYQYTTTTSTP